MRDNFEKLNQLLEQEQCEFTGIPDGFAGQTPDRKPETYRANLCD